MNSAPHHHQRGITLLEAVIALMLFSLLAGIALWGAQTLRRESQAEQFVEAYSALAQNIRARYRTPDGYVGLTFSKARTDGQIPENLLGLSTVIGRTPWGSTVDIGPGQAETDARAVNQSFITSVSMPDPSICAAVLIALAGKVQRIRVGTLVYLTLEPFQPNISVTSQQNSIRYYCSPAGQSIYGTDYYLFDS